MIQSTHKPRAKKNWLTVSNTIFEVQELDLFRFNILEKKNLLKMPIKDKCRVLEKHGDKYLKEIDIMKWGKLPSSTEKKKNRYNWQGKKFWEDVNQQGLQ